MWEDQEGFEYIWEKTKQEHVKCSIVDVRKFLKCYEDIDMGQMNVRWGPQGTLIVFLPLKVANALD